MLATEHTETNLGFLCVLCGKRKVNDGAILRNRLVCDALRIDRGPASWEQEQDRIPRVYDGQHELGDVWLDRRQLGDRFREHGVLLHASARFCEMAS